MYSFERQCAVLISYSESLYLLEILRYCIKIKFGLSWLYIIAAFVQYAIYTTIPNIHFGWVYGEIYINCLLYLTLPVRKHKYSTHTILTVFSVVRKMLTKMRVIEFYSLIHFESCTLDFLQNYEFIFYLDTTTIP